MPFDLSDLLLLIPCIPVFGYLVFFYFETEKRKAILRTNYDPVWEPADDTKFSASYKRYVSKQSEALCSLGFQPIGAWHAATNASFKTYATCFLHPQGHCFVQVLQASNVHAIEIMSYLDDGSIIDSSNVDFPEDYFSDLAKLGLLVQISPKADLAALLSLHCSTIQPVVNDPNVGLRKLTADNWRDYACYTKHFHNQCDFELGKKDKQPAPFYFPDGQCVPTNSGEPVVI